MNYDANLFSRFRGPRRRDAGSLMAVRAVRKETEEELLARHDREVDEAERIEGERILREIEEREEAR